MTCSVSRTLLVCAFLLTGLAAASVQAEPETFWLGPLDLDDLTDEVVDYLLYEADIVTFVLAEIEDEEVCYEAALIQLAEHAEETITAPIQEAIEVDYDSGDHDDTYYPDAAVDDLDDLAGLIEEVEEYGAGDYAYTSSAGWVNLGTFKGILAVGATHRISDSLTSNSTATIEKDTSARQAFARALKN